jgi:lipopolysaccharide export system permease protein
MKRNIPKPPKFKKKAFSARQSWSGKGFFDHLGIGEAWQNIIRLKLPTRLPRLTIPAIPGTNIIQRYLFVEMLSPFFISLLVATFVLFISKIIELTDLVVTRGVGLDVVGQLLLFTLPYFIVHTVPMASLLGVLLGFLRLSGDNEVTALKSAGVSLRQLLPPAMGLALFAWALTTFFTIWVLPWGNHKFESLVFSVAQERADLALRERVFMDTLSGLVIYINRLPGPGEMEDVFIVDERDPQKRYTVTAKTGKIFPAKDGQITMRLFDGIIMNVEPKLKTSQNAKFSTYDVYIDATDVSTGNEKRTKHVKEMTLGELYEEMQKYEPGSRKALRAEIELQQKFALPVACLIMALIGVTLGTHWKSGRSWGVAIALVVFITYYLMFSMSWNYGDTGYYPPLLGVWLPNLVFLLVGLELFRREQKELPFPLLDSLDRMPQIIASFMQRSQREAVDNGENPAS